LRVQFSGTRGRWVSHRTAVYAYTHPEFQRYTETSPNSAAASDSLICDIVKANNGIM
jgi:hypothetical protein